MDMRVLGYKLEKMSTDHMKEHGRHSYVYISNY
jgi:hypothetical protein